MKTRHDGVAGNETTIFGAKFKTITLFMFSREPNPHNTSTASSICSSHTPMSVSPALSPRGPAGLPTSSHLHHPQSVPTSAPLSPQQYSTPTTPTPFQSPNSFTPMTEGFYKEMYTGSEKKFDEIENVLNQVTYTYATIFTSA